MNHQSFTIRYNYAEMLAATWLTVRKRWMWKGTAKYLAVVGAIMTAIIEIGAEEHTLGMLLVHVVVGVAIAVATLCVTMLYWFWCVPRSVRKAYSQLSLEGGNVAFSFDDDHLEIVDSTTTLKLPWNKWVKWTQNQRLLLLYRTDVQAHYVPKAQVETQQIAAVVANLNRAGVKRI